jgi:hypothetical protein
MTSARADAAKTATRPDVSLSLALRMPSKLFVEDVAEAGGGVLLHLEVRNRNDVAWNAWVTNGPLLEIAVLDEHGDEKSRQTRQLKMLSPPTRLDPGRGFLLPLRVVLPDLHARGETFTLRFRFAPGTEGTEVTLHLAPRA